MTVDPVTWRNTRPKKRMGAGVLIRDEQGRVLLVEPTYKQSWEIPSGERACRLPLGRAATTG